MVSKRSAHGSSARTKEFHVDLVAERFSDVVVENLDRADVFEEYDGEDTVFYCDPPYVGYEDYSLVNTIGEAFVDDAPCLRRTRATLRQQPAGVGFRGYARNPYKSIRRGGLETLSERRHRS